MQTWHVTKTVTVEVVAEDIWTARDIANETFDIDEFEGLPIIDTWTQDVELIG
jgi:hypothetical protein